jgi:hypothetical protein
VHLFIFLLVYLITFTSLKIVYVFYLLYSQQYADNNVYRTYSNDQSVASSVAYTSDSHRNGPPGFSTDDLDPDERRQPTSINR